MTTVRIPTHGDMPIPLIEVVGADGCEVWLTRDLARALLSDEGLRTRLRQAILELPIEFVPVD